MADACRAESSAPEFPLEVGELARITGVFTDLVSGEAIDPDTVRFTYRSNEGDPTVLVYGEDDELVRDEAGRYHVDMPTSKAGPWRWRWEATGAFIGVSEGQVSVRPSGVS